MRKRIIITNFLMILSSLLVLLTFSIYMMNSVVYKAKCQELKSYLKVATNYYNGSNPDELIEFLADTNENIRATVILFDGEVIADSTDHTNFDSHLDRKEVNSLGTIVRRYSNTLKQEMIYIADKTDNSYIRVSISTEVLSSISNNFFYASFVAFIAILGISTLIVWPINKKSLLPLNDVTKKLYRLTNENNIYGNSIDEISLQIDNISNVIEQQIIEIKKEKNKFEYLMENINQGFILINELDRIELANSYAKKILSINNDYIGSDFVMVIRPLEIQEAIRNKVTKLEFGNYIYLFDSYEGKTIIRIADLTEEKSLLKMKREFFANASHELKSPLTTIIGYQQMIQQGIIVAKDEIKEATTKTVKEANRMNIILSDMLELSKLESSMHFDRTNELIAPIISEVIDSYNVMITNKNIKINFTPNDFTIYIFKDHLYTLLKNLLENAIKYNKNDGAIDIIVSKNSIEIKDYGIGISSDNIKHIFERFYRVSKDRSKENGGTGLGLAIVKHICQIYNFSISVNSTLGEYTSFIIDFKK